ncbi:hypothetical protein MIF8_21 [Erwinia phage MIF8]
MKICARCGVSEENVEFSKSKYTCKPCTVIITREYYRTPRGLTRKIYNNQIMTTHKMGRNKPAYSREELESWMMANGLLVLHKVWEASSYDKWLSPSIDRIDNTKSYSLDNIRLVTWRENLNAQKAQNKSGEYLHAKSKAVDQYTLGGVYVASYGSCRIAMRSLGLEKHGSSNIASACNGKLKTAYKYLWRWQGEALS